jgi:hypothetical protein
VQPLYRGSDEFLHFTEGRYDTALELDALLQFLQTRSRSITSLYLYCHALQLLHCSSSYSLPTAVHCSTAAAGSTQVVYLEYVAQLVVSIDSTTRLRVVQPGGIVDTYHKLGYVHKIYQKIFSQ